MFGNVLRRGLHFSVKEEPIRSEDLANDKVYPKCTRNRYTRLAAAIGKKRDPNG